MVQFYPGSRPKAVPAPPGQPLVSGHAQLVGPSPCPIGPSADERSPWRYARRHRTSSRSVDVQMDRYALTAGVVDRSAEIPHTV